MYSVRLLITILNYSTRILEVPNFVSDTYDMANFLSK